MADAACPVVACPIAVTQQRINSSFLCALNSYQETFHSIYYTNILSTKSDELVRPLRSSEISGLRIFSEHLGVGIYDYCGYYLTMNALRARSFLNLSSEECCSKTLMPRINETTAEFLSKVIYSAKEHARHLLLNFSEVKDESELQCSFRTDCIQGKNRISINELRIFI
jgi:hypothetical protein